MGANRNIIELYYIWIGIIIYSIRNYYTYMKVAEKVGFEPTVRRKPYAGLANQYLQPLGHLSVLEQNQVFKYTIMYLNTKIYFLLTIVAVA